MSQFAPGSPRLPRMALLAPCLAMAMSVLAGTPPPPVPPPPKAPSKVAVTASRAPDFAAGEVLVKFRAGSKGEERGALRAEIGASSRGRFRSGVEHWRLPPGLSTESAISLLKHRPQIDYVEPNYVVAADRLPDDPGYPEQYHLTNTGQTAGLAGADIDAARAWNLSTGSREVIVAIIDTGVDLSHPDLASNLFVNTGEIPGNGLDDDANGFIDDVRGWDFVNDDNNPSDDEGHGTHVAGIVGAVGNNGRGVSGVCWSVTILPVKFLMADGTGFSADAIRAIDYASLMGAQVMNNSWGGGGFSRSMEEAIDAAAGAGAVFVAAAGNDSTNIDVVPHFPASYLLPNVVAVAATDASDQLAQFSNYGTSSVLLGAPGVKVLSTFPGGRYGYLSGTSMAAPVVSGAAALLRAREPGLSVSAVRQRLRDTADPVPGLATKTAAGGRVNIFRMIAADDATPPGTIDDLSVAAISSSSVTLRWTATGDDGDTGRASTYEVRYSGNLIEPTGALASAVFTNRLVPAPAGTEETLEVTGLDFASDYSFMLRALDEWEQPGPWSNTVEATTLGRPALASSPGSFEPALRTGQKAAATLFVENVGTGTLDWRILGVGEAPTFPQEPYVLPPWLSVAPLMGRVAAGGRQEVAVAFDAAALRGGVYEANLELLTNDPDHRFDPHVVRLTVTDAPAIDVQPGRIDFGTVLVGASSARSIGVRNSGTVDLAVSGVVAEDAALFVDAGGFLLPPGAVRVLEVTYTPAVPSVVMGGLVIASDAANESAARVTVQGTALAAPAGGLEPASLERTLAAGDQAIAHLLLANGGGSDLVADIAADSGTAPASVGSGWLQATPAQAIVPPGSALDVVVRLDASGLKAAIYQGEVRIGTNEPGRPGLVVPVSLTVEDAPHLSIELPEIILESRLDFTREGETTAHRLEAPLPPAGGGILEFVAEGDFGNPPEKATLVVEGQEIGTIGGAEAACGTVMRQFPMAPEALAALLADGVLEAEARNTSAVNPTCESNRHTVRLRYSSPGDRIDFGDLLAGASRTRTIVLRNTGSLDLHLQSIAADLPGLFVSEAPAVLAPGEVTGLGLRLDTEVEVPSGGSQPGGSLAGALSVESDDPTSPRRTVDLAARLVEPPLVDVTPGRVDAALLEGRREVRTIRLTNRGAETADLALSIGHGTTGTPPGPCGPVTVLSGAFNTGVLETVDVATGTRQTVATGLFGPTAVAVEPGGRVAYVMEFNGKMAVVDLTTRTLTRRSPGVGTTFGLVFDAAGRTIYASSFTEGALFRLDPSTGALLKIASGLESPRSIALDRVARTAWVVETTRGVLSAVDLATGAITRVAGGLTDAVGVAVDPQGVRAYVGLSAHGVVAEVDLVTGAVTEIARGFTAPGQLALDESGQELYVAEFGGDRLSVLDLRTRQVRVLAEHVAEPTGLAVTSPQSCLAQFASVQPRSVRLPAGGTADIALTLDGTGLPGGDFGALLAVGPRQPFVALSTTPLTLTVVPRPRLRLSGQEIVLDSSQSYITSSARTRHVLIAPIRPGTAGNLEVTLEGDYGTTLEKGAIRLEGTLLGEVGGAGTDCIPLTDGLSVSTALMAAAAADGALEFEVQNSPSVAATCPVNRHRLRLTYRTADLNPGLAFGDMDVGKNRVIPMVVSNPGGQALEVTSIAASGPGFTVTPSTMSVPPGASQPIFVGFAAQAPGAVEGLLRLASNDPDAPLRDVALTAEGVAPQRLEWAPAAVEATITEGRRVSRSLTLFNRGGRSLNVTMAVQPPTTATITPAFASVPAGGSVSTTVHFISDLLPPGLRTLEVVVTSNDPVLPVARVPASVLVQADADRDAVPDDQDLCPSVRDPEQSDGDGDSVGDACDNCEGVPNVAQEDGDDDGSGDACQPSLILAGIREDGGERLEVSVRARDPQGDPLQGQVDLVPEEAGLPGLTLPFTSVLPRLTDIGGLAAGRRYRLILTVTDGSTNPVSREVAFLHQEETILVLDMPPRAVLSPPATAECDRPLSGGVRLDGSGSSDEDSTPGTSDDILSYQWFRADADGSRQLLGAGPVLEAVLPLGESGIVLRVTDAAGEAAEAEAPALVRDTAAPTFSLTVLPAVLWPPDHNMIPVRLVGLVADACDPAPGLELLQATSSEPDDAPGGKDGNTAGDIGAVTLKGAEGVLLLRGERDSSGPGRIYTITCQVRDRAGNATSASATASVPRTLSGR